MEFWDARTAGHQKRNSFQKGVSHRRGIVPNLWINSSVFWLNPELWLPETPRSWEDEEAEQRFLKLLATIGESLDRSPDNTPWRFHGNTEGTLPSGKDDVLGLRVYLTTLGSIYCQNKAWSQAGNLNAHQNKKQYSTEEYDRTQRLNNLSSTMSNLY